MTDTPVPVEMQPAGKPICIPGLVNKVLANVTRPIPYRAQYALRRNFTPFA